MHGSHEFTRRKCRIIWVVLAAIEMFMKKANTVIF
jgi:hypothetical protein